LNSVDLKTKQCAEMNMKSIELANSFNN